MVNWQIMRIFKSEAEANTTYTPLMPAEGEKFVPFIWMFTFQEYTLVLLRSILMLHNLQEYTLVLLRSILMLHNLGYWIRYTLTRFWTHSQNHEKRLLALSRLSVYWFIHTELDSHWTDIHEIWYEIFFKTLSRKFKFQQVFYKKIFVHLWDLANSP